MTWQEWNRGFESFYFWKCRLAFSLFEKTTSWRVYKPHRIHSRPLFNKRILKSTSWSWNQHSRLILKWNLYFIRCWTWSILISSILFTLEWNRNWTGLCYLVNCLRITNISRCRCNHCQSKRNFSLCCTNLSRRGFMTDQINRYARVWTRCSTRYLLLFTSKWNLSFGFKTRYIWDVVCWTGAS